MHTDLVAQLYQEKKVEGTVRESYYLKIVPALNDIFRNGIQFQARGNYDTRDVQLPAMTDGKKHMQTGAQDTEPPFELQR